ncbi:hypothetical protein, partial [Sandarakinorhabdus sp.]|uniref:beta strand repeat-containing protein n=1 Tax=Sandarakinorhabdus sp. TaxID=1916663 RepID=UPI0028AA9282
MRLFDESAPARSSAARAVTRLSLGASPAVLAAMLALQPQVAHAQAFQGTETVILGNVTRGTSGNNDFFTVNALQNTINWTPTDTAISAAPIDFLPTGAFASFSGGSGTNGANYTVLNRIIAADPTRAIAFSGTVSSDAAGRIWFYAPGGLLLNGGSQFNVGSLLLTANDPVGAAAGLPYLDAANNFRLQAGAASTPLVDIRTGAQINAVNSGSYVIAVAPRFNHAGAINVNGSAALVAAQDVSFTLNGGLFDITANVGSSAGGNQTVTGSITGPGGIGGQGVFSRIYMMAVPRNDAMTLLITGNAQLGFDIAGAADISGNAVVLSGGYDIVGTPAGQGVTQYGLTPVAGSVGTATISIDNADFTSNVTMRSKDVAQVQSTAGPVTFAADLEVLADGQAIVRGLSGNLLTVAGNLTADASTQFTGGIDGASRTAGIAEVSAAGGGSVQVSGNTFVYAVGVGNNASSTGIAGGTGTGGNASAGAFGGSLRTGSLTIDASGVGGIPFDGVSGSGQGGTARLQVDPDGTLTMAGNLLVSSGGFADTGSLGRQSGNATGGLAEVRLSGIVNVPGGIRVEANASYGESGDIGHIGGGTVTGGQALLSIFDGTSLTTTDIAVEAQANRGFSVGNNNFIGGQARFSVSDVNGGTSVTAQSIAVLAQATAANGDIGGNVDGGAATGGFAQLFTTGNPTVSGTQIFVSANANGGDGDGGIGGAALGGRAHLDMQNGGSLLISNNVFVNAAATGGDGTIGGNATAFDNGDANPPAVFVRLGPNVGTNDQGIRLVGGLFLIANANGGDGTTGAGGAARGGFVVLRGQSGEINTGQVVMQSDAFGGFGVGGGAARSGRLFGGFNDANLTTGQLFLTVEANGGSATDAARGGDATVGQVFFILESLEAGPGTTVNAGAVSVLAAARGGSGGGSSTTVGGAGGNAFAVDPNAPDPQIVIAARPARSSFIASQLIVDNSAVGGEGGGGLGTANGGRGGNAAGGNINIGTTSGTVQPLTNRSTFDFGTLYSVDGRVTGGTGGGIDGDGLGGRGGDA